MPDDTLKRPPAAVRELLQGMPSQEEIDGYISYLEQELDGWRAMKQLWTLFGGPGDRRDPKPPTAPSRFDQYATQVTSTPDEIEVDADEDDDEPEIDLIRFSKERREIIRAFSELPDGAAAPADVVRQMHESGSSRSSDNIVTNMQRMVTAGLLSRPRRGKYAVVPAAARIARQIDEEEGLHLA